MENLQIRKVSWSKLNLTLSFFDNNERNIVAVARKTKESFNLQVRNINNSQSITFDNLPFSDEEVIFDLYSFNSKEEQRLYVGRNINFKQVYYWVDYNKDIIAIPYITRSGHLSIYVGNRMHLFEKRLHVPTKSIIKRNVELNSFSHISFEYPDKNDATDARFLYVKINDRYIRLDETKNHDFSIEHLNNDVQQPRIWIRLLVETENDIVIYKLFVSSLPKNDTRNQNYQLDTTQKEELFLAYCNGPQEYRTFKQENDIFSSPKSISVDFSFENGNIVVDLGKYIRNVYLNKESLDAHLKTYYLFIKGSFFSKQIKFGSSKGRIIIRMEELQDLSGELVEFILVQPNSKLGVLKNQHLKLVQVRNKPISFIDDSNTYNISNKGIQVSDNGTVKGEIFSKISNIISVNSFLNHNDDIVITLSKNKKLSNIGILSRESKEFIRLPFKQDGYDISIKKEDLLNWIDIYQSKWEFAVEIFDEIESDVVYKKLKLENTFFTQGLDRFLQDIFVNQRVLDKYSSIIRNYVIIPYITKGGFLALSVRDKYFIYREKYGQSARLVDLKMKGSRLEILFSLEADYSFEVECLELKLRSSLENDSKFISVEKKNDLYSAMIDLSSIQLKEFYYEAFALLKFEDGGIGYSRLVKPTKALKNRINKSIFNYNFEHKDSHSVDYPFITNRNVLYIAHRIRSSEEGFKDKLNEWLAMATNKILKKWLSRKDIWIVFEKNSGTAQDNGYYFFKWMYENHPEKQVYYVIKKESKDYAKLQGMKNRVLTYMSFKHLLYLAASKLLVAPETRGHVFTWRQQKGRLRRVLDKKKLIFLQHGVTAFKHNDSVLDYNSPSAVTKYVVTSQNEQQIIHEGLHYPKEDIFVTGFARWDSLVDKSKSETKKKIFVMPTWRGWLDSMPSGEFIKTPYYKNYMDLLNSEKLNDLLVSNNVILEFFLHPKFKEYTSDFQSNLSNIKILDFNKVQVNEKLMESSLLITDYSSVSWDMHYLNKPVLFYQFDYQDYMNLTGSYIDIKKNLFGNSSENIENLINQIHYIIANNFINDMNFESLRNNNFAFTDANNSKRIFEAISKSGLGE